MLIKFLNFQINFFKNFNFDIEILNFISMFCVSDRNIKFKNFSNINIKNFEKIQISKYDLKFKIKIQFFLILKNSNLKLKFLRLNSNLVSN